MRFFSCSLSARQVIFGGAMLLATLALVKAATDGSPENLIVIAKTCFADILCGEKMVHLVGKILVKPLVLTAASTPTGLCAATNQGTMAAIVDGIGWIPSAMFRV